MEEQFRTAVIPEPAGRKINHADTILVTGSCFAENIGARLEANRFKTLVNPNGVLFNPFSICSSVERILHGQKYSGDELFLHEGLWRSFDYHSSFSSGSREQSLQTMNDSFMHAQKWIEQLDILIITLGTSFVYIDKDSDHIVTNCHKLPHDRFERRLCGIDEITARLETLITLLRKQRPELFVIITISPVRHLRDNPHENQVSKAHLISSVHNLEEKHMNVYYFPAYEIMMDDLRDYRFYDRDMAHPNETAIEYIWARFIDSCVAERSRSFITEYLSTLKARGHVIHDAASSSVFAQKNLVLLDKLHIAYPEIDLSDDMAYFRKLKTGMQ
jgi:hypothetical protein